MKATTARLARSGRMDDRIWDIASFRGGAAIQSLSERSGHLASRAYEIGSTSTRPRSPSMLDVAEHSAQLCDYTGPVSSRRPLAAKCIRHCQVRQNERRPSDPQTWASSLSNCLLPHIHCHTNTFPTYQMISEPCEALKQHPQRLCHVAWWPFLLGGFIPGCARTVFAAQNAAWSITGRSASAAEEPTPACRSR